MICVSSPYTSEKNCEAFAFVASELEPWRVSTSLELVSGEEGGRGGMSIDLLASMLQIFPIIEKSSSGLATVVGMKACLASVQSHILQ